MSRVLALFVSSFLVKKSSEMKKQKESRNYSFPPGENGNKTVTKAG